MEYDTEGQVESREHQQGSKPLQQYGDEADLEHEGVEQHQQNDDQVEQDGNVLDTVGEKHTGKEKTRERKMCDQQKQQGQEQKVFVQCHFISFQRP